jgi:predicted O-methyltransferase YrrM
VSSNGNWVEVDHYIADLFVNPDPVLDATLEASAAAGLPDIEVAPSHGKLLMLLATIRGARRILEIGTLGGYSTIWLARALPADGRLISLEASAKHADVARANIERAGLSRVAEVRVGQALDTLPKLAEEGGGPFDFVFIDADKPNNSAYLQWALKLSRLGTVIVVDNVVRYGAVTDDASSDSSVKGVRSFMELIAAEPRVSATAIQTVCIKGHDGFALAVVKEDA